jgi:hypothetical protein
MTSKMILKMISQEVSVSILNAGGSKQEDPA